MSLALHSVNSLSLVHGFTPYQIVIGLTPMLPPSFTTRPKNSMSGKVSIIYNTIVTAGNEFVSAEKIARVRRVPEHSVKPSRKRKFLNDYSIFYKPNSSKNWRGPGKVIAQKQKQVLTKYGCNYVRLQACKVLPVKESLNRSTKRVIQFQPRLKVLNTHCSSPCIFVKNPGASNVKESLI